ncbi:MAG: cytochrome C biosynthesis protein [Bacteroides sp.]|nr:cytochrome C biosynthesis protein [Bacteroides sp.]MCM1379085.1 cytochrome C biosynthesis protein [Bacteroides sp.]MCM1445783.1 cytochrome C biosynthesis protein [Prevotella sp.]
MQLNKIFCLPLLLFLAGCSGYHKPQEHTLPIPELKPDYAGVTFAPNIAAPSFTIQAEAEKWQTQIGICGQEPEITLLSEGCVEIPLKKWHSLLNEAKGDSIYFRFAAKRGGKWLGATGDVVCPVSDNPIDGYLVYRLLYPGYELWSSIGIYERNLENYDQKPILENKNFDQQCINCHNFSANDPERGMMIHVRGHQGGTLISRDGKVEKINSNFMGANHGATYPGWSRDGKFIAFSANDVGQIFHSYGPKPIEVLDKGADLMVYNVETRTAYSDSAVTGAEYFETFPNWSPDNRTIYFCRARSMGAELVTLINTPDSIHYNLCAIDFDPATGSFSNLRTLYDAEADSASVSFPRCSPDGRWLMFTRSDYGTFSIWHPESQLCLMDLQTGLWREMDEVNSESIDSYHSWSSDGRWFVFSSKRLDGLWARPYIAAFDPATGRAAKPFALPQKSATFYDTFTKTFNIPELISSPVVNVDALLHGIISQQPITVTLTHQ